jgi:hypothetical protein
MSCPGNQCLPRVQPPICLPRARPYWHMKTNLKDDKCYVNLDDNESQEPGCYQTDNFYRLCDTSADYANLMSEPFLFYKPYRSACRVNIESELRNAELTNMRQLYPLYTTPYLTVPYMGAGQNSLYNKEIESQLLQGLTAHSFKPCSPTSGVTINRFDCLPDYGNPQKVEHIIEPWNRSGDPTRDYIRRVNYTKACFNSVTNSIVNGVPPSCTQQSPQQLN